MSSLASAISAIDIALSFTDSAGLDVDIVLSSFEHELVFYDYRRFLDVQTGASVRGIAEMIYPNCCAIVFATRDWFTRPATMYERQLLEQSHHPKLVFDYSGRFAAENTSGAMSYVSFGGFQGEKTIDPTSVRKFTREVFKSLGSE